MNPEFHEKKHLYDGIAFPIECLSFSVRREPPERGVSPHYHDYIEFLFGLDPCAVQAQVAGETVMLGEGDLLIVNSGVPHSFLREGDLNCYLCIKALPEVIYSPENSSFDVKYILPFLQTHLRPYQLFSKAQLAGTEIAALLDGMMREWEKKEYGYEIALKRSLLSVFLWLIRTNHRMEVEAGEPSLEATYDNIRLVRRSLEYIDQHYAEINEAKVAEYVNLSYSYFSKIFYKVMGKHFNDHLTAVRLHAAERLLLSGDKTVTEIALATGFCSSSHFIDRFRKAKGMTPKQYRTDQKNLKKGLDRNEKV